MNVVSPEAQARFARNLGLPVAFLAGTFADAVHTAENVKPAWAQDVRFPPDDEGVVVFDGTYGDVQLSASVLFGEYASLTSEKVMVDIGDVMVDTFTAEEMRALCTSLSAATDALENAMKRSAEAS